MRYNSQEYVDVYNRCGEFPSIHDYIFNVASTISNASALNAADLGASTGLLTIRLRKVFKSVTGYEASDDAIQRSVSAAKLKKFKITPLSLKEFEKELLPYDIIIARRVFPELYDAKVVFDLPEIFFRTGIKYILLEGRKPVARPSNPLWSADLEAKVFENFYRVIKVEGEVRLLEVRTQ
ncbi:hypothetical protein AGMMS49975_06070 [Clostridia bacterium]|nr:hypothetical protein AGMMS49975_06070 [Clostridia bacterium]